ncbi:hypothetical protein [Streptomyces sp. NBC_01198]|uniref:hypothetical protein n=1 Tax=Streptomyces sp. NBC_01198 TaxID=2903769 RepID=UPI002E142E84|nr:hypothetical protein OG702_26905 [Streptomyces sp. NBC_01198]
MSSEHDDHGTGDVHEDRGTGTDDDILVGGDAGGHPRERSPRRRLTVALVAAAVLAAAGGGAHWAVSSQGDGRTTGPKRDVASAGPGVTAPGTALPGSGPATALGGDFRLTGTLPQDGPASAPLYRPDGGADRAAVARLAALLGLTGPVVADHGSWRVGSAEGTGPALLASQDAPGSWSYARNGQAAPGGGAVVPPALPQVPPPAADGSANSGSTSHKAAGSGAATPAGAPVSEQQAEAAAAPVLDALGLSGAQVGAATTVGATRTVTAGPVVGGLPTHGWDTTLDVGPDGHVTGGHGRLSALAKGESSPVISADQAFKNLSSTRVMHPDLRKSCQVPEPAQPDGKAGGTAPSPTLPGQDKTLPHSLPCVAPHVPPTDITGARFGLAPQFVPGGEALAPAWLFDAKPEGATAGSVIAEQAVDQPGLQGTPTGPSPAQPPAPDGSHRATVSGYQPHGSSLTLTFWGGVCETYHGGAVESDAAVRVTVTATVTSPDAPCPDIIKAQTATVQLAHPLSGRQVLDATTGTQIPGS